MRPPARRRRAGAPLRKYSDGGVARRRADRRRDSDELCARPDCSRPDDAERPRIGRLSRARRGRLDARLRDLAHHQFRPWRSADPRRLSDLRDQRARAPVLAGRRGRGRPDGALRLYARSHHLGADAARAHEHAAALPRRHRARHGDPLHHPVLRRQSGSWGRAGRAQRASTWGRSISARCRPSCW